jgi:hypothetical protein
MAAWKYKIYVGDIIDLEVPDDITWEAKRDAIVQRIVESGAYRNAMRLSEDMSVVEYDFDHEEFLGYVENLRTAADAEEWDDTMYYVYNYFDDHRIWFDIFDKTPPRVPKLFLIPREEV